MSFFTRLAVLALTAMWGLVQVATAQSQDATATPVKTDTSAPDDQGWHVYAAPYLWLAGISGTVGAAGREASIHVSAGDLLSNLNIGIMGAVEAPLQPHHNPYRFHVGETQR